MIIDCKADDFNPASFSGCKVFVDGQEIIKVFYVDTDAGIVKTYAFGEESALLPVRLLTPELIALGQREGWDMPDEGLASRTIHGTVEVRDER